MNKFRKLRYANDNEALIPELWAQESVALLKEKMIVANLVHRDFEDEIANFGDVVNTRKPRDFSMKRKTDSDDVTVQDAISDNIPVPLNQHMHTSFMIRDGEASKAFKDLVAFYLDPAITSLARGIDKVVLGQAYRFLGNTSGKLRAGASKASLLDTRMKQNIKKVPESPRYLVLTPQAETDYLNIDAFITADKIGDEGTALRDAVLGRKMGYWMLMAQNTPSIGVGNTVNGAMQIDAGAGYPAGATVLTVDGGVSAANAPVGAFLTIVGDDTPQRIIAATGDPRTQIVISPGLRHSVLDNAFVTIYAPGAVNFAAGYNAGYAKEITVNGFTVAPQVGQLVSFGTQSHVYSVIDVSGLTGITLDRPLEQAIAHTNPVNIGPAGDYNFAFHKNALALVVRPLILPRTGNVLAASVSDPTGISLRVVIAYDPHKQGHLVTVDLLAGVQVLDTDLGHLMFS